MGGSLPVQEVIFGLAFNASDDRGADVENGVKLVIDFALDDCVHVLSNETANVNNDDTFDFRQCVLPALIAHQSGLKS